ncbi:MAG: GlsB/YeaQ/YmgE family stress response membrane protein [Mycobacterium sp.]
MFHILGMLILGLIVGAIARFVVPGKDDMGWILTCVLGIAGAWVGGTLGSLVFAPHKFELTPPINHSFLGALVGAVILVLLYRQVKKV